jgi:hypothetical protein
MDSWASDQVEISALDGRVARVLIRLIVFIDRSSISVTHRRWLIGFVSRVLLFPTKAQITGEEIGEVGSMLSQAVLMSGRFHVDSSEISAILIGQATTAVENQGESRICLRLYLFISLIFNGLS